MHAYVFNVSDLDDKQTTERERKNRKAAQGGHHYPIESDLRLEPEHVHVCMHVILHYMIMFNRLK